MGKEEVKELTSNFDEVKYDHMREIERVKADERMKREKEKWMYEYKKRHADSEQHKKEKKFKEGVVKAVFKLIEDLEKDKKEKLLKQKLEKQENEIRKLKMEKKIHKQNIQEMQKKKQITVKKFKEGVVKIPKRKVRRIYQERLWG